MPRSFPGPLAAVGMHIGCAGVHRGPGAVPGLCRGCVKWLPYDFSLGGGLQAERGGSEEPRWGVQGVTAHGGRSGMAAMGTASAGMLEDGMSPGVGGHCGGFAEHRFCSQKRTSTGEPRSHFWEGFWDQASLAQGHGAAAKQSPHSITPCSAPPVLGGSWLLSKSPLSCRIQPPCSP